MTSYTSLAAVKNDLGIENTRDDQSILRAIATAGRRIDRLTGTTFGATEVYARQFIPTRCCGQVWIGQFTDVTDLEIKTGSGGTFTTTVADTDFVLWPYDANARKLAYRRIDSPGNLFFREWNRPTVEVTAKWGWHYVPEDVETAARLIAIHLFHRQESPHGQAGYADDPAANESNSGPDADVADLLRPYGPIGLR